jgi:hypothetical protein
MITSEEIAAWLDANRQVITRHDQVANLAGPEGTRHAITEVDRPIHTPALDVGMPSM